MTEKQTKQTLNYKILIEKQSRKLATSATYGQDSISLAQVIKQYQFSPQRTEALSTAELDLYFASLLISGQILQLKCALIRNFKGYAGKEYAYYSEITELALRQDYATMQTRVTELESASSNILKHHFTPSLKGFIIRALSADYITISTDFMQKNYGITVEDLNKNGCKVANNFVTLPEPCLKIPRLNQLMQDRVSQVSTITESVIRGGIH